MTAIDDALNFAMEKHCGQYRKRTGVPFIVHPLKVLEQVSLWKIEDLEIGQAVLLHDIVEDTKTSLHDIEQKFGEDVADLVMELTFFQAYLTKDEYLKSFDKKSITAVIIKIADRLSNVKDLVAAGDTTYAAKYLLKAQSVFENFLEREPQVVDKFGIQVFNRILKSIYDTYIEVGIEEENI